MSERIETGVMTPEGDWPGIFIRGDEALVYGSKLRFLLDGFIRSAKAGHVPMVDVICWNKMQELIDLLESCRAQENKNG